jgi:hypothetical protein
VFESEGEGSDGGIQELTTTVPAGTAAKRLSRVPSMFDSLGVEIPYPT